MGSSWRYLGKLTVKLRLEQVKTLEIGKASSCKSDRQVSGSKEEAIGTELLYY